ncbi:aldehyde dehydrogenase [Rhodococcus koreensis]
MPGEVNYSKLYIGGEWVAPESSEVIEVISPWTEKAIGRVPAACVADADKAVGIARSAFDEGGWPRMAVAQRRQVIARLIEELRSNEAQIASLISSEMGCPISAATPVQAVGSRRAAESFLRLSETYPFEEIRAASGGHALVTREPVGVVVAIIPWNVPLTIAILKLVPALLVGCTAILKPAPETPLNANLLAEMLDRAGLPKGVLSVLPADRETSQYLVTNPAVDKIAFTGSSAAGRRIAALCGQDLRRVTLELGGKSAAIILDDADLDATVAALRDGSLRNSGQICSLKTRIVVPRELQQKFSSRLADMMSSMPVGDPSDPATAIGPLVSSRQRDRVESYIEIGRAEGAELVLGGGRPKELDHGWFVEPTLFTEVDPAMRIAQEEIFGPVLAVLPYDDVEQAIAIANDSDYGLNGAVFTSDAARGLKVARQIRTGTVELNGKPTGYEIPNGGFKASGIGRERGFEGFDAFTETKAISLPAELAESA